jgi:7-carboxy-7-deazaguanine synthase
MINIHETFQQTIQGEGFYTGTPCDFIRTYGCPVGCYFCDTGYEPDGDYYNKKIKRHKKSIEELLNELKSNLIVISGGEPFINKNLPELCNAILKTGRKVSIETSGSYWQEVPKEVFITLSPKEHISPKYPVLDIFWNRSNEFKLVISNGTELEHYIDNLKNFKGFKYLQPEYNEHSKSLQNVLNLLKDNQEFKLSLQTHKIINVK